MLSISTLGKKGMALMTRAVKCDKCESYYWVTEYNGTVISVSTCWGCSAQTYLIKQFIWLLRNNTGLLLNGKR